MRSNLFSRGKNGSSEPAAADSSVAAPAEILHLEATSGIDALAVRFDAITAWVQHSSFRAGTEDPFNVAVHLSNGETSPFLGVDFDTFTDALREHYGDRFESLFLASAPYATRCFVRRAHILGFSAKSNGAVHVVGKHALPGFTLSPDTSFGTAIVTHRKQSARPADTPDTPVTPSRVIPTYSVAASYNAGALVQYEGSIYRRAAHSGNAGSPAHRPNDWQYLRTESGPVPSSAPVALTPTSRERATSTFDPEASYGYGDIVQYRGASYRKLTRRSRGVQPDQNPMDWDRLQVPESAGLLQRH